MKEFNELINSTLDGLDLQRELHGVEGQESELAFLDEGFNPYE